MVEDRHAFILFQRQAIVLKPAGRIAGARLLKPHFQASPCLLDPLGLELWRPPARTPDLHCAVVLIATVWTPKLPNPKRLSQPERERVHRAIQARRKPLAQPPARSHSRSAGRAGPPSEYLCPARPLVARSLLWESSVPRRAADRCSLSPYGHLAIECHPP